MKKNSTQFTKRIVVSLFITLGLLLGSCSKEDDNDNDKSKTLNYISEYILVTFPTHQAMNPIPYLSNMNVSYLKDINTPEINYEDYYTNFFPNTMGFYYQYEGKWLFTRAGDKKRGIQKYTANKNGELQNAGYIEAAFENPPTPVRFTIANDNQGYFVNQDKPFSIQEFNPTTMQKGNSEINIEKEVREFFNPLFESEFKSKFSAQAQPNIFKPYMLIGHQLIVESKGKLYVNIHCGSPKGKGFLDNVFPNTYIAVIDLNTKKLEKIITIPDSYHIGLMPLENMFLTKDEQGNIYTITMGWHHSYKENENHTIGMERNTNGRSKIFKIDANTQEIDNSWTLSNSDLGMPNGSCFESITFYQGKLYTSLCNTPKEFAELKYSPTPDFEFYSIDINTRSFEKIKGIPKSSSNVSCNSFFHIDDDLLIRVENTSEKINGFYKLDNNNNTAKQLFNVKKGVVKSITKLKKQ